jgi:alpha-tubulin suppressor-like RCC1 family protein
VVGTTDFGSDAVQSPAPVGITNATSITVGKRHACALLDTGGIACWGDNSANELGTEAPNTCHLTQCSDTPVDVPPPM